MVEPGVCRVQPGSFDLFLGLLARRALCSGLAADHKQGVAMSREPEKQTFANISGVSQNSPSPALQILPDAPHRAAICAWANELF
ncbi:MAG: hypothetical protein GY761_12935 [Hyphomicrobiales bacterium]|nr:hypothetical protein [Hyphomicrobiales bacterium]